MFLSSECTSLCSSRTSSTNKEFREFAGAVAPRSPIEVPQTKGAHAGGSSETTMFGIAND